MRDIIKINVPIFGEVELDLNHVVAIVPRRRQILFASGSWYLDEENFNKVSNRWNNSFKYKSECVEEE